MIKWIKKLFKKPIYAERGSWFDDYHDRQWYLNIKDDNAWVNTVYSESQFFNAMMEQQRRAIIAQRQGFFW